MSRYSAWYPVPRFNSLGQSWSSVFYRLFTLRLTEVECHLSHGALGNGFAEAHVIFHFTSFFILTLEKCSHGERKEAIPLGDRLFGVKTQGRRAAVGRSDVRLAGYIKDRGNVSFPVEGEPCDQAWIIAQRPVHWRGGHIEAVSVKPARSNEEGKGEVCCIATSHERKWRTKRGAQHV
ncbi:hypothetical protein HJG60_010432 [Phyllostomus discolor]|uniref:Uncharacterized protein n=1 Tax=Phyllostomus discolor TaxID=89673 RepID=A0A834EER6_9CHIR|nr:hypothetical protein HJG60_010432 [Phyllostomus discolor]